MVIAPNHPSLLDAVMILSRLPGATCIMKADIVNSVFFGAGARLAGYIRNTPLRTMVQLAIDDVRHGSHVLLFPEGTRTTRFPVGCLQGTTGLIAKHAGVPVQTVFIETDSGFLGKGWSLLWTPRCPSRIGSASASASTCPATRRTLSASSSSISSRSWQYAVARLSCYAAAGLTLVSFALSQFHANAMNSFRQRFHRILS
jgi:hypothetical protein